MATPAPAPPFADSDFLQISGLLLAGVSNADIVAALAWVDRHVPPGVDPLTWQPTAADLLDDLLTPEAVADARADWLARVPARYRQVLDAVAQAG